MSRQVSLPLSEARLTHRRVVKDLSGEALGSVFLTSEKTDLNVSSNFTVPCRSTVMTKDGQVRLGWFNDSKSGYDFDALNATKFDPKRGFHLHREDLHRLPKGKHRFVCFYDDGKKTEKSSEYSIIFANEKENLELEIELEPRAPFSGGNLTVKCRLRDYIGTEDKAGKLNIQCLNCESSTARAMSYDRNIVYLRLTNITVNDAGKYECRLGTELKKVAHIHVAGHLTALDLMLREMFKKEGENLLYTFALVVLDDRKHIQWHHVGLSIKGQTFFQNWSELSDDGTSDSRWAVLGEKHTSAKEIIGAAKLYPGTGLRVFRHILNLTNLRIESSRVYVSTTSVTISLGTRLMLNRVGNVYQNSTSLFMLAPKR